MTAKDTKTRRDNIHRAIRESAEFNGRYLRQCETETEDRTAIATARCVSVLQVIREMTRCGNLSPNDIQAAIDGFMSGAQIETHFSPMGAELFRSIPQGVKA